MIRPTRALAAALLAGVVALAGACSSSDSKTTSSSSSGKAADKVTYVTAFGAVGRDSFIWVAKQKGFFADAGIDVDIHLGAAANANLEALKAGNAQFAALDFTGAELQAGLGKFTDWRAVAAIHQQTLVSIMTTADTNITRPTDLKGKTIATTTGSVNETLFPAYAKLAGLDPKTVKIQSVPAAALNGLMAQRKVDALSAFLLSQKALETVSKKQVVVMPYSQYLSDLFGNAIITTPETIATKHDLVQRFVNAAMKGLDYTVNHPDEAASIMHQAVPTAVVPAAVAEINAEKPYVTPANGAPIGHFDQARVERGIAVLQGAGLIPAGLTPDKVVDFSFIGAS
jgi:NitT/TauT family transport system substrate-binding protein